MQFDIPITRNPTPDWALQGLEGTNVNFRGVGLGLTGIQSLDRMMTEPPHTEGSVLVVQLHSLLGSSQFLVISGIGPNLTTPHFPAQLLVPSPDAHLGKSLAWMAFTREALKDSRPMTEWEQKAAADFFWSEFD